MNLIWLSDIQLDFLSPLGVAEWIKQIVKEKSDGLVISGNIATGSFITSRLQLISAFYMKDIYFVLGENDYRGHSYTSLFHELTDLTELNLKWLPQEKFIQLDDDTALVGTDTFPSHLLRLGEEKEEPPNVAENLKKNLAVACKKNKRIIFAVSSSPFLKPKANTIGEILLEVAQANPDHEFYLFSGQAENKCTKNISKNLTEYSGGSKYGSPTICGRLALKNTLSFKWDEQTP